MTSTQGLTLRIVLGGLGIGCQFTTGGWSIDTIATNFFVDFVVFTVRHSVGILLGVTKGIGFKQRLVMMFGTCRHDCRGIAERRSQQQHHHPPPSDPVRGRSNEHRGGSGGSGGSSSNSDDCCSARRWAGSLDGFKMAARLRCDDASFRAMRTSKQASR